MRLVKRDRTRKGDVLPHWKSQAICTVILSLTPSSVSSPHVQNNRAPAYTARRACQTDGVPSRLRSEAPHGAF